MAFEHAGHSATWCSLQMSIHNVMNEMILNLNDIKWYFKLKLQLRIRMFIWWSDSEFTQQVWCWANTAKDNDLSLFVRKKFLEGKAVWCWWSHQAACNEGLNLLFFYGFLFFLIVCWWNLVSTLLQKIAHLSSTCRTPPFHPSCVLRRNLSAERIQSGFLEEIIIFLPCIGWENAKDLILTCNQARQLSTCFSFSARNRRGSQSSSLTGRRSMQHLRALVLNYRTCCAVCQMDIIWNSVLPPLNLILQSSRWLSLSPVFPASLEVCVKEAPQPMDEDMLTTTSDCRACWFLSLADYQVFIYVLHTAYWLPSVKLV